jgi:hypothetical protein
MGAHSFILTLAKLVIEAWFVIVILLGGWVVSAGCVMKLDHRVPVRSVFASKGMLSLSYFPKNEQMETKIPCLDRTLLSRTRVGTMPMPAVR